MEMVSSFSEGVYLQWAVSGNILIAVTRESGVNAVLSGLFLDPIGRAAFASSATLIDTDTTTEGSWIGPYGAQGYDIADGAVGLPGYATVATSGATPYLWSTTTTDPRALEDVGGTGSLASCWYSSTSFAVDVDLTDGLTHDLSLYFLDWDSTSRAETVQISDALTGAVLSIQQVTSFHTGTYLTWAISGNVAITIKKVSGVNAVVGGLFLE
jgi:cytochrome c